MAGRPLTLTLTVKAKPDANTNKQIHDNVWEKQFRAEKIKGFVN